MKKSMKILALVMIIAIISTVLVGVLAGCEKADETLIVYNWEDYIDIGDGDVKGVVEEFEEYYFNTTGKTINVRYETFDTNETMLTKVLDGNYEVDLMCPSEYAIQRLIKENKIQPISKGENALNKINSVFEEKLDETFGEEFYDYVVPYMWGTLGILYNTDVISEDAIQKAGWGILWNDVEDADLKAKLNGKIYMKDSVRDAYVAATMYLKEENDDLAKTLTAQQAINLEYTEDGDLTENSENMITKAFNALSEQSQGGYIKGYEVDNGKDEMVAGTAYVNLAWSGDAFYAIEEAAENGVNLAYYAPSVGGNLWFDGWVMSNREGVNKEAAEMFVEFVNRPDIAMRNMMYIGYVSAVDESAFRADDTAMAILADYGYDADEFFGDHGRYPTAEERSHLGVMKDFGTYLPTLNALWEGVKVSGTKDGNLMWIIFVAVAVAIVLIAVGVMAYKFRDKKKYKKRRAVKR